MTVSIPLNEVKRKQLETQVSDLRVVERVTETISLLQECEKNTLKHENEFPFI